MVVHEIEDDPYPHGMGFLDKALQTFHSSVAGLYGKDVSGIVTPGSLAGKVCDRHQLDDVEAHGLEIS